MRNVLSLVPRGAQGLVGAWVRTIFAQPDQEAVREQLELVADSLAGKYPKAADLLREAGEDVIAHMAFPREHWRRIHSTNVRKRLHRGRWPSSPGTPKRSPRSLPWGSPRR